MGRKIPLPKRHFGVRDPLQQLEEREAKIRDKINNPPKDSGDQEVSKKFKKFVEMKDAAMKGKSKKPTMKKVDDDFKATKIDLEDMRKHAGESNFKFMKRVDRVTNQRKLEAAFAAKYNVDIVRNQETGEIKLKKRKKDEIEELMKKKRAEAKNGKRNFKDEEKKVEVAPKVSTLEKMKLKKKAKKASKDEEKSRAFAEYQHEEIKFGETAMEPPTLVTPRRAQKVDTVARPGKRELLLTSMLTSSNQPETVQKPNPNFNKPNRIIKGPIDKKGKRKNLPNSTRVALESARLNAVDLYRQMKKKKPIVPIPNRNLEDF